MPQSLSDKLISSIIRLAETRHPDAAAGRISVSVKPFRADGPERDETIGQVDSYVKIVPDGLPLLPSPGGPTDRRLWQASVHRGGGRWGHCMGVGATAEEALIRLHAAYMDSHRMVDERRQSTLADAERINVEAVAAHPGLELMPSPERRMNCPDAPLDATAHICEKCTPQAILFAGVPAHAHGSHRLE